MARPICAWSAVACLFFFFGFPTLAPAADRVTLSGHRSAAIAHLSPIGRLPESQQLRLAIGLPLRDPVGLSNRLREIYDPASPNYHHYQTPEEFTAMFGPTALDYETVIQFARAHGLNVTGRHANRLVLEVTGSVQNIEQAFQVKMNVYQHPTEARTFFAPDVEPSVEAGVPILDVDGLNNYIRPRPKFHRQTRGAGDPLTRSGSGPDNLGYMGSDYRAAYAAGITNTGIGQTIGLVEFDGYYTNDIRLYETNAHISTNLVITNILLDGFNGVPSTGSDSGNGEVALDIEMSISMAPGCRVFVYEAPSQADTNGYEALGNVIFSRIATDNVAKQISCCWIVTVNATSDNLFQEYAMQGQTFFDASGDDDAYIGIVPSPSDDPYLTQVGGTVLTTVSAGGAWAAETTWNEGFSVGSSGGVSSVYPIPSWQTGVNMSGNMGSMTMRNFPDVAMVATNVFVVADNGALETFSGTSCAAPLWAGFTALVNQQAIANGRTNVGFLNPALYQIALQSGYSSNFHDITTGNNTNYYAISEFFAVTNYDLCTGLGSPAGSNLFNSLLAAPDALQIAPLPGFAAAGSVGGPFNLTSQTYVLTNTGSAALTWTNYKPALWLTVSTNGGTLAAGGSKAVTVSLNSAASNLTAGVYTTSVWFTNQTSHLGQSRQFSLSVGEPLVENGGFETADFSYWVLAGNPGENYVDDGTFTSQTPHSGKWFAVFGTTNYPLVTLTQTVPALAGEACLISFWLLNPNYGFGSTPNQLVVSWNGTNLFNQTNFPFATTWTNLLLVAKSAGTSNTLQFGFLNNVSLFCLDDVTVKTIPLPTIQSIKKTNSVLTLTWTTTASMLYQLQYKTNLTQTNWINLGSAVTATGASLSGTDAVVTNARRFYRVELFP